MPSDCTALKRYEQVADHLRGLIAAGTYGVEDRLPAVRPLSSQMGVSITTVLEAYRLLEDQGLVQARPQSGYYVSGPAPRACEPADLRMEEPVPVGMGETLVRFLRDLHREHLIQFGAACPNPDLLPTARLARCLARVARDHEKLGNSYDLPPGCEALRIQIARRAQASGCGVGPEEVLLTLGCQEALYLCLQAICQPGDTVVVESPTFYGHLQAIEMLGLKALEIPSDPVSGMSMLALRQALEDCPVKAILVSPSFSNPTGSCLSDEQKRHLLDLTRAQQIPIIEDDIFGELSHSPQRPRALRSFDREDRVLLCSSFSKTLAPGYRVGWILTSQRYRSRLLQLKTFSNLGSPVLPALAIADFLSNGGFDHHLRACRKTYARLVHGMAERVLQLFPPGTTVTRPRGGFVLWVQLPPGSPDLTQVYSQALQRGLTFGPGPLFSARGRFSQCLRLCAPYWGPQTETALARLAELLF